MKLSALSSKKQTLKRRLCAYLCVFALLLCALLTAGLFLVGNFTGAKQRIAETLAFQIELFERQIDTYYDNLAVMSVQLSNRITEILEGYLDANQIAFDDLNDSEDHIRNLQEQLIDAVRYKLWEADCTGTFVMLEAQVNSSVENADTSRTGIYLQRNSLEAMDTRVLLYRGLSQTGKEHDCMPHRKWRLEFRTDFFPNYEELKREASFPLNQSYRLTDVVLLPGTDQHVMLMTIPLLAQDGTFYGICGFELNEGYFRQIFAQPSELDHAVFCLSKSSESRMLSESTTLSAGILNEYYLEPKDLLSMSSFGSGLTEFRGESEAYIGMTREICICPSTCTSAISVLIPKADYVQIVSANVLRLILLIIAFLFAAIGLSMFFAKQYLQPIKNAFDSIRRREYSQELAFSSEITDLFAYLARQDQINEAELDRLRREKTDAISAADALQSKMDETARQNERLAYSRKDEIDPMIMKPSKAG